MLVRGQLVSSLRTPMTLPFRLQPRTTFVDASSPKKSGRRDAVDSATITSPKRQKPKDPIETAKLGAMWGFSYQPEETLSPDKKTNHPSKDRTLFSDTASSFTASTEASSDFGWTDFGDDSPSSFKSRSFRKVVVSKPLFPFTKSPLSQYPDTLGQPPIRSSSFTPRQIATKASILDQPFEFWQELNVAFVDACPTWTGHQRKRMIHHLVHFLELKVGMDEYVPTLFLLPTPVVEEAWKTLVTETFLYLNVVHALQDFHGRPRAMIHYSNRENRQVSYKERIDRIRRTQSLFWLYFKEPMPVTITEEHEGDLEQSPPKPQLSFAPFESSRPHVSTCPQSLPVPHSHQQKDIESRSWNGTTARNTVTQNRRRREETDAPSDEEDSDVLCDLGMMEI